MEALSAFWRQVPPAAVQLRHIAQFLGIRQEAARAAAPTPKDEALRALGLAGLPLVPGRPDDPMLELL